MDVVDLIRAKRGGARLTDEQISWLLKAYVAGEVADEQVSALLMAIVFQGMTRDELAFWTQCMIDSGERLDLSLGHQADRRQALDRRRRRQDLAGPGAR